MKLSHLTIAISVALGLAACGGSSNNVDNSTTTTGGGSGGAGGAGGTTTTTPPPPPEDGPDVVKEANRAKPGLVPEARSVDQINSAKRFYTGLGDRQSVTGYQDYNEKNTFPTSSYVEQRTTLPAPISTHYVDGVTDKPDILRSGSIYNYVDEKQIVGTGLHAQGVGMASNHSGAVVADPGFTYAKGDDGRYYRMKPASATTKWNQVSAKTRYVPVNDDFKGQFSGGSVSQKDLVFIPNAREFDQSLKNLGKLLSPSFDDKKYDYKNTGDSSLDSGITFGGVDAIRATGDGDFILATYKDQNNNDVLVSTTDGSSVGFIRQNYYQNRRGTTINNSKLLQITAVDGNGDIQYTTVLADPATVGGTTYSPVEVATLVYAQNKVTELPTAQLVPRPRTVSAPSDLGNTVYDIDTNTVITAPSGVSFVEFTTGGGASKGDVVYRQAYSSATNTPVQAMTKVDKDGNALSNLLKFQDFDAIRFATNNPGMLNDGSSALTANVRPDTIQALLTQLSVPTVANAFNTNRGVVRWNHLTVLGKNYDLSAKVTSKNTEIDLSSLKVANEIQDVPLTVNYSIFDNKGTTTTDDDVLINRDAKAGMLKVYNLPYHRSLVNINQDAVDNNPDNRGFYDSFQLSKNGVGNGSYGALQVKGVETLGIPWNGRATYRGKSYGIYTDGQYVNGDIILSAEFAKDRPGVSGTVVNRKLADGSAAPDMLLKRVPLLAKSNTGVNWDTGTKAMNNSNVATSGSVEINGVQNAGIWDFQLYGPNAEEIGGLIQYGTNNGPVTGQWQPGSGQGGSGQKGYNEVFSAQRGIISETSNHSQLPGK